jgi:hypothetical protein
VLNSFYDIQFHVEIYGDELKKMKLEHQNCYRTSFILQLDVISVMGLAFK